MKKHKKLTAVEKVLLVAARIVSLPMSTPVKITVKQDSVIRRGNVDKHYGTKNELNLNYLLIAHSRSTPSEPVPETTSKSKSASNIRHFTNSPVPITGCSAESVSGNCGMIPAANKSAEVVGEAPAVGERRAQTCR